MKPAPFAYARARTTDEALTLLDRHGEDAMVLAGGQSLVPALNMRLAAPDILIDVSRIPDLAGIRIEGTTIHIGALTTHAGIEHSAPIREHLPLLAQAAPHIAHPAVRNAGTLGGSLATADPASEWPACCVALGAELIVSSSAGTRRVKAEAFFKGALASDLRRGEILTGVEFALPGAGHRAVFLECARRRGDYALAGVAATASVTDHTLHEVRLAYLGAGDTPLLARQAMAAAEGRRYSPDVAADCGAALGTELAPASDPQASAAAKLHLARVLTGRALAALAA